MPVKKYYWVNSIDFESWLSAGRFQTSFVSSPSQDLSLRPGYVLFLWWTCGICLQMPKTCVPCCCTASSKKLDACEDNKRFSASGGSQGCNCSTHPGISNWVRPKLANILMGNGHPISIAMVSEFSSDRIEFLEKMHQQALRQLRTSREVSVEVLVPKLLDSETSWVFLFGFGDHFISFVSCSLLDFVGTS